MVIGISHTLKSFDTQYVSTYIPEHLNHYENKKNVKFSGIVDRASYSTIVPVL